MKEALNKLRTEMEANKDNPYIQYVGGYLIGHVKNNPEDAEKILNAEKTIGKSLDAMRKVAEKKKIGNVAMLTPDEGLKVVLQYFEIKSSKPVVTQSVLPASPPQEMGNKVDFEVNLDDLLGGL